MEEEKKNNEIIRKEEKTTSSLSKPSLTINSLRSSVRKLIRSSWS
jgi:hypothetical protein